MAATIADTVLDVAKEKVNKTEDSLVKTSGGAPFVNMSGGTPAAINPLNTLNPLGDTPFINTSGN